MAQREDEPTLMQRRPSRRTRRPRMAAMMVRQQGHMPGPFMQQEIHEVPHLLRQIFEMQNQEENFETRPAEHGAITALPTHIVQADEVAMVPDEHRACTICMEDFK